MVTDASRASAAGGTRPIRRVLIANRGEIARRIIRTAHDLGMTCVAVYSTADNEAPHVAEADLSVQLPGEMSTQTYLDGRLIIEAAARSGADAIHPGYGFLSENPEFAADVIDAGLIWIGPPPAAIRAMALKVEAKQTAARAGVPLVPGAELGPDMDEAELIEVCAPIGYPLLVKASAGGGGRGMRVVGGASELGPAVSAARREAASAFGDPTVFVERLIGDARHVEVQVFADTHGNVVHLFERECSIQRRHQKVIEEAPSCGITEKTRDGLFRSATALARAVGYVGAGTVEFLVSGHGPEQSHAFLEMNTRLQVEHAVTEAITGIDLVAWQFAVAQGEPLPLGQQHITCSGHAIEARLYAEDPAQGYLPAPGLLEQVTTNARDLGIDGIRIDSGVENGSSVTTAYDPMLAKVIGHGPTRQVATARLALALRRMRIHGPVTNRDALVAVLDDLDFRNGSTTTDFLDSHSQLLDPRLDEPTVRRHLVAVAFAQSRLGFRPTDATIASGWRNVPAVPQFSSWRRRGESQVRTVRRSITRAGRSIDMLVTDDVPRAEVFTGQGISLEQSSAEVVSWEHDDKRVTARVHAIIGGVGARHLVSWSLTDPVATVYVDDGFASTTWHAIPRFAAEHSDDTAHHPVTPVPGTITGVHVIVGDVVAAGHVLVTLEAMKMEHRIRAGMDGQVSRVMVQVGDAVDAHAVVVELVEATASQDQGSQS